MERLLRQTPSWVSLKRLTDLILQLKQRNKRRKAPLSPERRTAGPCIILSGCPLMRKLPYIANHIFIIVALCINGLFISNELAAEQTEPKESVETKIEKESEGNVIIDIPDDILELILKPNPSRNSGVQEIRPGINKLTGYRIQVFSDGRNQSTLEARAKARGSAILARFPKYRGQVYTYSSSPNWYTRIGNFLNQQEANTALVELKQAFPNYASEMRVVKCQIVVIKQ